MASSSRSWGSSTSPSRRSRPPDRAKDRNLTGRHGDGEIRGKNPSSSDSSSGLPASLLILRTLRGVTSRGLLLQLVADPGNLLLELGLLRFERVEVLLLGLLLGLDLRGEGGLSLQLGELLRAPLTRSINCLRIPTSRSSRFLWAAVVRPLEASSPRMTSYECTFEISSTTEIWGDRGAVELPEEARRRRSTLGRAARMRGGVRAGGAGADRGGSGDKSVEREAAGVRLGARGGGDPKDRRTRVGRGRGGQALPGARRRSRGSGTGFRRANGGFRGVLRAVLRQRLATLGADRLGDVVLDLEAVTLSAWLADPAAR